MVAVIIPIAVVVIFTIAVPEIIVIIIPRNVTNVMVVVVVVVVDGDVVIVAAEIVNNVLTLVVTAAERQAVRVTNSRGRGVVSIVDIFVMVVKIVLAVADDDVCTSCHYVSIVIPSSLLGSNINVTLFYYPVVTSSFLS